MFLAVEPDDDRDDAADAADAPEPSLAFLSLDATADAEQPAATAVITTPAGEGHAEAPPSAPLDLPPSDLAPGQSEDGAAS